MNQRPTLGELDALARIVSYRSFRKAADALGLAPSTLSHMIRALEARLGVRLLHRTTRSVSPTAAGERLLSRLQPALAQLDHALRDLDDFRQQPSGRLRINGSEPAVRQLLAGVVPRFLQRYPQIELDLVTEGRLVDIVAEGFDAGIRLGEAVPHDMIAVPLGGPARFIAVASPAYLAEHGQPATPEDLQQHRCIRIRLASGKRYRWEFSRHGQSLAVDVPGTLTLDHLVLMAESAARGLGIAYVAEATAAPWLARGELVTVLDAWCPPLPGLRLYYPGHRLIPPPLQAFIDVLREPDRR